RCLGGCAAAANGERFIDGREPPARFELASLAYLVFLLCSPRRRLPLPARCLPLASQLPHFLPLPPKSRSRAAQPPLQAVSAHSRPGAARAVRARFACLPCLSALLTASSASSACALLAVGLPNSPPPFFSREDPVPRRRSRCGMRCSLPR